METEVAIEETEGLFKNMNSREITILVYELYELYSNLPFMKNGSVWGLIDETTELNGKGRGKIVKDSINFFNLGKSRNLKQYVFNYKITTQTDFWGVLYKKQSFYPLMGWEKLFGKSPTKDELKEPARIEAFQKFMETYKTSFSEKHFAVWEHMKVKRKLKVYDSLSDKASEIKRTEILKDLVEASPSSANEADHSARDGLLRLKGVTRLTSWHIKNEDLLLKRDRFDKEQRWEEGSGNPRPSDGKSDHEILRGWTGGDTTYDKILDKFSEKIGSTESGTEEKSILDSVIDNRKIERNSRALENSLAITSYYVGNKSIRGGAAIIAAIIALKQMKAKPEDFTPTTKMKNFQHHSFFENIGGGTWNIVEELKNAVVPEETERSAEDDEMIKLWKKNFQNGVWLKLELPSVPHAITVIIKDGKIFSAGGGYNDATIAIGGDGGFHYGDFYLYSPDHLFSDWDDQMYNAQNIVGWGFYNKKIQEKIEKYKIEKKSKEGYLKVKGRKYCTIANSFFGSNCARFTNDITDKGLDVFYSSPASNTGYSFQDLNDIFFEIENDVYLKNIDEFKEEVVKYNAEPTPTLIINNEGKETDLSKSIKKLLMPNYSIMEKQAWEKKGLNDREKQILYRMKNENELKQLDIDRIGRLDLNWPFKQDDRDKLHDLIKQLEEWKMMRTSQQQGKEPDLRTPLRPPVLPLPALPRPSEEEEERRKKQDKKRPRGDDPDEGLTKKRPPDPDSSGSSSRNKRKFGDPKPRTEPLTGPQSFHTKNKQKKLKTAPPAPTSIMKQRPLQPSSQRISQKRKISNTTTSNTTTSNTTTSNTTTSNKKTKRGGRKKRSRRKKKRKGKKKTRRLKK